MSDTTLHNLVLKRLDAAADSGNEWYPLVMAALEGPEELESLLEGPSAPLSFRGAGGRVGGAEESAGVGPLAPSPPPRIAFLRTIAVEGFRGIGPKATLDLTPGPGLTLVVGRNGSGKSSFAEALELLLTGETYRWENRSKVWKDGWRNLHHPKAAIAAEFALEGEKGTCTVAREWQDGPDLDAATTWAQVHGKPRTGKEALGWDTPLASYRPFLSYNELGSMLDEGPSKLYDALSKVLGLDALVDAQAALQQARSARDNAVKEADRDRKLIYEGCGLRLCWPVDADQGARQRSSASHRDIDRGRQPIDAGILGADDDPGMSCDASVQAHEVPPVEGQDRPAQARGELRDGIVRDSQVGLASFERRQHVVPQPAERLDDRQGEALVRVERAHGLRSLVPPDLLIDLLPVRVHVRPRVDEVRGTETRVAGQDLRLGPAEAPITLEHPHRDSSPDDACRRRRQRLDPLVTAALEGSAGVNP